VIGIPVFLECCSNVAFTFTGQFYGYFGSWHRLNGNKSNCFLPADLHALALIRGVFCVSLGDLGQTEDTACKLTMGRTGIQRVRTGCTTCKYDTKHRMSTCFLDGER
jgi:hypothetical protein